MTRNRLRFALACLATVAVACSSSSTAAPEASTAPTSTSASRPASTNGPTTAPSPGAGTPVVVTTTTLARPTDVDYAYNGGFSDGWQNYGWSTTTTSPGPAQLELGNWGGFILYGTRPSQSITALTFEVTVTKDLGQRFLRVGLGADGVQYPDAHPQLSPTDRDGVLLAVIPMNQLINGNGSFDRIVISADLLLPTPTVVGIDRVGFVLGDPAPTAASATVKATAAVQCRGTTKPISDEIYGTAFNSIGDQAAQEQWEMGATGRRWGGNVTSRYNWRSGHFWNTAADYFFRNVSILSGSANAHEQFVMDDWAHGEASAITVPMLGWVAKDGTSYSFPVTEFGPQRETDPEIPDAGNGISADGKTLTPSDPSRTSVPSGPGDVEEWVRSMKSFAEEQGKPAPFMYFLDNEPELWSDTHRDVRSEPIGYDELLSLTIEYASAIRRADPDALIAGPSPWGWPAYFASGKDQFAESDSDRKAHGDTPLIEWYLEQLHAYEQKTGQHLLDVLDVHFYPQNGIYGGGQGETDPATSARRIRSTRSLWDPTYVDESYIQDTVMLIPRMQQWVDENDPGLKLSIGEYSFGAEQHMSGALAQAEALGRFGQQGLYSAYYWTRPPAGSPVFWAFRAFRDYDGAGATFGDVAVPSTIDDPSQGSLFASTDAAGSKYVLVLLNFSTTDERATTIDLSDCHDFTKVRSFDYRGDPAGFQPSTADLATGSLDVSLPPYSITVVELS